VLAAVIPVGLFVLAQIPLVWQWHAINQAQQEKHQIREEMLRLQWLTADIENGFRGYVLTSQTAFLRPVVTGEAKVQDSVERLLRLTQKFPNLQARVKIFSTRLRELIESKRQMTLQFDNGKQEDVFSYIRSGEGLVLSKTIEKAVEDFEGRLADEFAQVDLEEKSLKEQTIQRLLIADAAMLIVGIVVARLVFRSAMNDLNSGFPSVPVARQP
jgi:CHASE3 domain sensor protein